MQQIKQHMLRDTTLDGEELPSRRMLAAQLGVNPNTMQKAFVQLESEGLIRTPPNAKSQICINETIRNQLRAELLDSLAAELVARTKEMGLDYKQLADRISKFWDTPTEM